jgi:PilZ domain
MAVDRRRAERERRAALRVPAVFAVKCVIEERLQLGQAEDVGPGGLTMRRPEDKPLAPGAGILLTFGLPGGQAMVATHGVVITDHPAGSCRRTGVRFLALPADEEQQIAAFCLT